MAAVAVVAFGTLDRPAGAPGLFLPNAGGWSTPPRDLLTSAVCLLAVVALVAAWVWAVRVAGRRPMSLSDAAGLTGLWAAPFALGPALFSRDVFAYAAQGELASRGFDPYAVGPAALGRTDGYVTLMDPIWRSSKAPYGPAWLEVSELAARGAGHRPLLTVFLLRLIALASVAVSGWLLVRLARRGGADPALVLLLGIANPLVLLHLVSGGHNDALVLALVLGGLELASRRRVAAAVCVLALAASVKVPAATAIAFVAWGAPGEAAPVRARIRALVDSTAVAVVVMAAVAWATGFGWGWVDALRLAGGTRSLMAPLRAGGIAVDVLAGGLGAGWDDQRVRLVTTLSGAIAAVALVAVCLWRSGRRWSPTPLGVALLALAALGPALYPWYLVVPFAVLAIAHRTDVAAIVLAVSGGYALLTAPSGSGLLDGMGGLGPWVVPVGAVSAVVWWSVRGGRRDQMRGSTGSSSGGSGVLETW